MNKLLILLMIMFAFACSESDTEQNSDIDLEKLDGDLEVEIIENERVEKDTEKELDLEEAAEEADFGTKCNGFAELCGRKFNQVAYATTHNSFSSAEREFIAPNHNFGLKKQLEYGVRGFLLDVYYHEDEIYFCHGDCNLGKFTFKEGLQIMKDFMDLHPREVISFFLEQSVSDEDLEKDFKELGLFDNLYGHDAAIEWPTLGEMIKNEKTLVIFGDCKDDLLWCNKTWSHMWDTSWENKTKEDLSCKLKRGQKNNSLIMINHFYTSLLPHVDFAKEANSNPFFIDWVTDCMDEKSRIINFLAVDYYSIGDLIEVTNKVNEIAPKYINAKNK